MTVGFSDHSIGDEIITYAFLRGAKVIEKHFSNNIKTTDLHLNLFEKGIYHVDDLIFSIGKTYFIHGPSGFGKTTLIDTFVGYRKPYKGKVLVDNINFDYKNRLSMLFI